MPTPICPRCGQQQIRLDPTVGCIFCGRGNTQIYTPLDFDSTQPASTAPVATHAVSTRIGSKVQLRFATLFAAAQTLHAQANQTRTHTTGEDANLIDATLVQLLYPLVQGLAGDGGWLRAARLVLDVATTAQIDALVAPAWSRAAVRIATLVMVPDVEQLASLAMAHSLIDAAIQIGAPAFNAGDVRGCVTVYWATALTLVEAPLSQRNLRLTQALTPLRQAITAPQAAIGADERALRDYAWMLRHAFDEVLHTS